MNSLPDTTSDYCFLVTFPHPLAEFKIFKTMENLNEIALRLDNRRIEKLVQPSHKNRKSIKSVSKIGFI